MAAHSAVIPRNKRRRRIIRAALAVSFLVAIAALAFFAPVLRHLGDSGDDGTIAYERAKRRWMASWGMAMPGAPDVTRLSQRLAEHGVAAGAPIFMRIFKREFELELWMRRDGVFHRFAIYPICRWSGTLGPKLRQGDHQTPEGVYTVDAGALNPNSKWYRSFNLGFPNAYDAAHDRTGSFIMVHGGCASVGCFAMTNAQMSEIWQLVTAALSAGQKRFQVQVMPFRLSDQSLAAYGNHPDISFWRTLKTGSDLFDRTLLPPRVRICQKSYQFEAAQLGTTGAAAIEVACRREPDKS